MTNNFLYNTQIKKGKVQYFEWFHNDNEYSYSSKREFKFPINFENLVDYERYYKVFYSSRNNIYRAEFIDSGKKVEVIYFDDDGKVVKIKKNDLVVEVDYEDLKKEHKYINKEVLSKRELFEYQDDRLLLLSIYDVNNLLISYTTYDYEKMKYQTFTPDGKIIEIGEMIHIGK